MAGQLIDTSKSVKFTRQQIEYLEKQFPEIIGTSSTPNDEYRFRAGQRSVVAFIRSRVANT